jgi:hypothetical protein
VKIEEYEYGRIVVDGREETQDLIITPDGLHPRWWREDGHSLCWDDLGDVIDSPADLLIVGTGTRGNMRPAPELDDRLDERGIACEVLRSHEAVERWNEVVERDDARPALAIHLTC